MRKPILAFACSLRSRVKVLLDLRSSGSPNVESQASNYGGKRSEIRIVKQDLFEAYYREGSCAGSLVGVLPWA